MNYPTTKNYAAVVAAEEERRRWWRLLVVARSRRRHLRFSLFKANGVAAAADD
jgi:hypothetical protein